MDFQMMVLNGALFAVSLTILFLKTGIWRRILPYHWALDIFVTIGLIWLFQGTYSGTVTAGFAGIFMSVVFWLLTLVFKAEKPVLRSQTKSVAGMQVPVGMKVEWVRVKV